MDKKLLEFLNDYINKIERLAKEADEITHIKSVSELGNRYYVFKEELKDAYEDVNRSESKRRKLEKKDPSKVHTLRSRCVGSVYMTLLESSAHKMPQKNSKDIGAISNICYVVRMDLTDGLPYLKKHRDALLKENAESLEE